MESRAELFIEKFLTLGGGFAGQPFKLLAWQKDFLRELYRVDEDGRRHYQSALLTVARKNGKSQLAAALGLFHLVADSENGDPSVVVAAKTRDQARLIFDEASRMIRASASLSSMCVVLRSEIRCPASGGVFRAVASDAGSQHGLNPSVVIFDELHTQTNSSLWDALTTASGARPNPLLLSISTAGDSKFSLLGNLYEKAIQKDHFFNGVFVDKSSPSSNLFWGYGPEGEYDYRSYEKFCEHNPSHSIIQKTFFEGSLDQLSEATIRQLFHNEWVASEAVWLPLGAWDRLYSEDRLEEGDSIVLGFDPSRSGDAAGLVAVRVSDFLVEDIKIWESDGSYDWLVPTDDVDHTLREVLTKFNVVELTYDPFWMGSLLYQLEQEGYPAVAWPTNSAVRMVPAINNFFLAVMEGRLKNAGSEALHRHLANCRTKTFGEGVTLRKPADRSQKIDAAIAAVIAFDRATFYVDEPEPETEVLEPTVTFYD